MDGSPAPASIHFAIPTETSHCKQHPAENIRLHEHTGGLPLELEAFHCIRDVSGLLRVASLVLGESVPARPYDSCPFGYMAGLGSVHQDIDVEARLRHNIDGFQSTAPGTSTRLPHAHIDTAEGPDTPSYLPTPQLSIQMTSSSWFCVHF